MRNTKKIFCFFACLIVVLIPALSYASDYPSLLSGDRDAALLAIPAGSFAWEARRLVKPDEITKRRGTTPAAGSGQSDAERYRLFESTGLSDPQKKQLKSMRIAPSGDTAYAIGIDLPPAVRLYAAGAVDYRFAKEPCSQTDLHNRKTHQDCLRQKEERRQQAIKRFQAVIDLPTEENRMRVVWAAYMLGKMTAEERLIKKTNRRQDKELLDAARHYFVLTRERAYADNYDPEELATASYGEEAGLYLIDRSRMQRCAYLDFVAGRADCAEKIDAADLKTAIGLYARQAALGSPEAAASLYALAKFIFADVRRARRVIDDTTSRRLLIAYALACDEAPRSETAQLLVDYVKQHPGDHNDYGDRLALLAQRGGRPDLAERLVSITPTPITYWLHAKWALSRNDVEEAKNAYQTAEILLAASGSFSLQPIYRARLRAEQGILALLDDRYETALIFLLDAAETAERQGIPLARNGYALDTFYIAERVMTRDELHAFVNTYLPGTRASSIETARPPTLTGDAIRYLLGRRMLRDKVFQGATNYFPESGDVRFKDPQARDHAQQYIEAIKATQTAISDRSKAEALFALARIVRTYGLEIIGYELAPDWRFYDGRHTYSSGISKPANAIGLGNRERQRAVESAAVPDQRFHYRYLAADTAIAAAEVLPHRSQAYYATLCWAGHWLDSVNEHELTEELHRRFLRQGAQRVASGTFGRSCPEPDFATATEDVIAYYQDEILRRAKPFLPPYRLRTWAVILLALTAALLGSIVARRRRRFAAGQEKT